VLSFSTRVIHVFALSLLSAMMCSQTFAQDEWPLVGGDYWDVTGVEIKDGGSWEYANWLATEWRKNEEFSKAQWVGPGLLS
jgi:hypothetical protein